VGILYDFCFRWFFWGQGNAVIGELGTLTWGQVKFTNSVNGPTYHFCATCGLALDQDAEIEL